jgi:hypothetical protein
MPMGFPMSEIDRQLSFLQNANSFSAIDFVAARP